MHSELKAALALHEAGKHEQAAARYRKFLKQQPTNDQAMLMYGRLLADMRKFGESESFLRKALKQSPQNPVHLQALGNCLRQQGKLREAAECFKQALVLKPSDFVSLANLTELCDAAGIGDEQAFQVLEQSLDFFRENRDKNPDNLGAWGDLAKAYDLANRKDASIEAYLGALKLDPENYKLFNNLACLYKKAGRMEESEVANYKALAIKPDDAAIHANLGGVMQVMGKDDAAIASFKTAIFFDPKLVEARMLLANLYWKMQEMGKALDECDAILKIDPHFSGAYNLKGIIYSVLGKSRESAEAYRRTLECRPSSALYHSNFILSLNYDASVTPEQLFQEHLKYAERFKGSGENKRYGNDIDPGKRLKVGYVSSDFSWHSVAFFFYSLARYHNKEQFEIYAYSNVLKPDDMSEMIRQSVDHWVNIVGVSMSDLEKQIRADGIDILVDLHGHTGDTFLPAFARKPAPVQVSWLGYPNTTGLRQIDYRISDEYTEPSGIAEQYSTERIYRLEEGFHSFYMPRGASDVQEAPCIRNGYITFGSFNNSSKINPGVMHAWAEILKRVPQSRLYIKNRGYMHEPTREFVYEQFEKLGVSRERITIVSHAKTVADHLDHYHQVDIALDTFPYNGTTTTVEAFYMGVPVVAYSGDRHAARVSASLLAQVNLGDWVASDINSYIEMAVTKAAHPENLARLRKGLRQRLLESSICDYRTFARKMESAFREMWIEWSAQQGAEQATLDLAREANGKEQAFIRARALARKGMHAQQRDDQEEAIANFQEALSLNPGDVYTNGKLADLLHRSGLREQALGHYEVVLKSSDAQALQWANYGSCLQELGRHEPAVEAFEKALEMNDAMPGVHMNLGAALRALYQYADALKHFEKAIELYPEFAEAYDNLGGLLKDLCQFDDAVACYCRALELKPGDSAILSNLLMCLHYVPGMDSRSLVEQHQLQEASHPGVAYCEEDFPHLAGHSKPLRIAYLSPDFRRHSVYWFIRDVLKHHSREQFSVWVLSDVSHGDQYTREAADLADRWVDTHGMNHAQLFQFIRDNQIDVLVELSGHTAYNRLPVLSSRAAPLQCSWLGYPFHPGSSAVDCWITDSIVGEGLDDVPQLVLPEGSHVFAPDLENWPEPEDAAESPLLVSCNNLPKINDIVLSAWAKILQAVPAARLAVKCKQFSDAGVQKDFLERCEKAGISGDRVELHAWSDQYGSHLELYRKASLALDTFPYNGTTTTAEALWMGVPVVSCSLDTPASHVGKSLLHQVGKSAWAAQGVEDYIDKAISMAKTLRPSKADKVSLRSVCVSSSMGRAESLVTSLEKLLLEKWEDRVCALQPSTIAGESNSC